MLICTKVQNNSDLDKKKGAVKTAPSKKQGKMKIKTERGSKLGFGNTSQSKQVLYSSIFEKARGDFTAKG